MLVAYLQLFLVQQLNEISHQLGFMLGFGPHQLLQLFFQFLDRVLCSAISIRQVDDLAFQFAGPGGSKTRPFKQLDRLLVVLLEDDRTKPLLRIKMILGCIYGVPPGKFHKP